MATDASLARREWFNENASKRFKWAESVDAQSVANFVKTVSSRLKVASSYKRNRKGGSK